MEKHNIYFRADGNAQIGLGHVFRSLALAEMLQADFNCHFVIQNPLPILKTQILAICTSVIELPETANLIKEAEEFVMSLSPSDIIVFDGYHFKTKYQQVIKNKGIKVVCIDDIHAYHFVADAVINHVIGVTPDIFSYDASTKLYLGTDYALIRTAFYEKQKKQAVDNFETVFINMGGADPNNATCSLVSKLLSDGSNYQIKLVLGGAFSHKEKLNQLVKKHDKRIQVSYNLQVDALIETALACDFGIVPSSTISYELCALGIPLLIGYSVDAQIEVMNIMTDMGLGIKVGDFRQKNIDINTAIEALFHRRKEIYSNQIQYFHGLQRNNLINIFENLIR